jgi:hypothetical protein
VELLPEIKTRLINNISVKMAISVIVSFAGKILKYLLGLTIITLLLPIAATVFTPLAIFRYFVCKSAPHVRSDLGKMVSSLGVLMSCANVYKSPEMKINIALVIAGSPSKEKARSAVKAAFEAKDPRTGLPCYPELKQNVAKWMGYPFWKDVKDFNFDEHFLWCENEGTISHNELTQRLKERSFVPFTEDKALWRFTVYPKFLPNPEESYCKKDAKYSVVIFEVDHCLADGFSIMKLVYKICGVKYAEVNETPKKNSFQRLTFICCVLAKLPYDFVDFLFNFNFGQEVWPNVTPSVKSDKKENCQNKNYFCSHSTLVPFQKIKDVRQKHGVKSVSLTIAAFTAALRNVLFEGRKESEIPKSVVFFIPFPLPGHPDKLRNHL